MNVKHDSVPKKIIKFLELNIGLEFLPNDIRFNKPLRGVGYGHIRNYFIPKQQEGGDGEALDCYVAKDLIDDPESASKKIFLLKQKDPETGAIDEYKVGFGFKSISDYRLAYLRNIPRKFLDDVIEITYQQLNQYKKTDADKKTDVIVTAYEHSLISRHLEWLEDNSRKKLSPWQVNILKAKGVLPRSGRTNANYKYPSDKHRYASY